MTMPRGFRARIAEYGPPREQRSSQPCSGLHPAPTGRHPASGILRVDQANGAKEVVSGTRGAPRRNPHPSPALHGHRPSRSDVTRPPHASPLPPSPGAAPQNRSPRPSLGRPAWTASSALARCPESGHGAPATPVASEPVEVCTPPGRRGNSHYFHQRASIGGISAVIAGVDGRGVGATIVRVARARAAIAVLGAHRRGVAVATRGASGGRSFARRRRVPPADPVLVADQADVAGVEGAGQDSPLVDAVATLRDPLGLFLA